MISLKQSYEIEYDGTENTARFDLFADTASDLTGLTHFDDIKLLQGSETLDISTGDHYILQSSGTWIKQPSGSGGGGTTYTREEIDDFLADKQDLLTFGTQTVRDSTDSLTSGAIWSSVWSQMLGLNTFTNLAAGDDLDDFTTPGIYRCTGSSIASQLINMPSSLAQQAGGRLIVFNVGGSGRYIQLYISAGTRFWLRSNTSAGWQPWYEYAGTQVV